MIKTLKTKIVIDPICETLSSKYCMIYGYSPKKASIEWKILEEIRSLKETMTSKEALEFSNLLLRLYHPFLSTEKKLWREFVCCHLFFLYGKKIFSFDIWILGLVCDAINKEQLLKNERFITLLSDAKWMKKIYDYSLWTDFSSSLTNYYQINDERVQRLFLFFCKRIEICLKKIPKEMTLEETKIEIYKILKSYQSDNVFKRSVVG